MGVIERGSAVPMLLLAMLSALPLSILLWPEATGSLDYQDRVGARLAAAKSALVEYAVTYPQNYADNNAGPGHFPCPDTNGNGSPGPRCPALAAGLLPRGFATSTHSVQGVIKDPAVATEPLIWVVAGPFRNRPAPSGSPTHAMVLNSASVPALQLDDLTDVVGLLIAPGPPLSGQQRGVAFRLSDYLEGENADGDHVFSRVAGNDRVLAIRWSDVLPLVERQVLAAVRQALVQYRQENGRYPWLAAPDSLDVGGATHCDAGRHTGFISARRYRASAPVPVEETCAGEDASTPQPVVTLPGWLIRNFWHTRLWLDLNADGVATGPSLDGQPVDVVLVAAGLPLKPAPSGTVQRDVALQVTDLLDHTGNTDNDSAYHRLTGGNDQWLVIRRATP